MNTGNLDWFVHDRFGMFLHWGIFSVAARHEWVQSREQTPAEAYAKYMTYFDPDLYDPAAWARLAKRAGMKYAIITAKHHDGFAMWDTQVSDFKVTNAPAGRDVLREWVDAFRAEGLKVGFYFSVIDWHHPDYTVDAPHPLRNGDWDALNQGRDMARYREFMHAQVRELVTNYGTLDVLWFDWTPPQKSAEDWGAEALTRMVREAQPGIILNDRIGYPEGADIVTPEEYQAKSWPTRNGERVTWESCQTMNGSWGYYRDNLNFKSPDVLIQLLIDTVSKGGNLLLNVGPTARGEIQETDVHTLEVLGEWMRRHGRAIYGATAADGYTAPSNCRLTCRGDRIYVHILNWPMSHIYLEGFASKVEYAQFLHDGSEVRFKNADPNAVPQNTDMAEDAGDCILSIPVVRPNVLVPVVELFMKPGC